MTPTSKTLVFFGNERLVSGLPKTSAPLLRKLISSGYAIRAVVTHHSDGKSRQNRPLEVADIAKEHDIPVLYPNKPAEIIDILKSYNADAGILSAYGRIIPQSVIDVFPHGIINLHPSLLPAYRGSTPIESAILNGDKSAGVSIMALTSGMDCGPVYAQKTIPLSGDETKFDLYDKLSALGATLLTDMLPSILDGLLQPDPQDEASATYCQQLTKESGVLNPATISAIDAERRVRAYLGFPKTKYNFSGKDIIIIKSHVENCATNPLDVPCTDGSYLHIDELIAPSGRKMSGGDFLNGLASQR